MMKKNIFTYQIFGTFIMVLLPFTMLAQQSKEERKLINETKALLNEANEALEEDEFVSAEADYRKAIAINDKTATGKYNLGTAYYGKNKNAEAKRRFLQAAQTAETKSEKHKAFHNLGNTLMNDKDYQGAVEAYKNALRNNPTDDETRYNLALAKDMLEKNPPQGGDGEDENQDQNQDQQDQQQNQDQQDQNEGDQGENQEGDQGDEQENQDQGEQEDNKEGDQQKDKGQPDQPKDQEGQQGEQPQQQQPMPGQLSPQQVKNLLEAMNNEEEKVQDKINAKKQKGAKVKSNKDW